MKSEVYIINIDTPDELLARVMDAVGHIKKREDQIRRTTRDLHTRVAKFTEVDGAIFEYLLQTVTDLSFKY
jgi:ferritin